jgi:hypothetical protein
MAKINLTTFFSNLGIVSGDNEATNFYDFWNGIEFSGGTITYNITDFMTYLGTNRYEFFKSLNSQYPEVIDEYTFYSNINDPRIYDFLTFYSYAGEYFGGVPITPTPTSTPTITPTNTPTPTPTYTPYLSPIPVYSNVSEFVLVATGSTIPAAGEIVFNNANACFSPQTTIMRISYTDRLGANVESKVKSYTGATGSTQLLTSQWNFSGSSNGPAFIYQTISFTDYGTYLELVHNVGSGTCASGLWGVGNIIQLARYTP